LNGCLANSVGRCELVASGSGEGPLAGSCEYRNESAGSIKDREFHDQLSDY